MRSARVVAQAKLNLFLHVLAREESGYHTLETLFQRLALGDDVVVRVEGAGRSLDSRGADVGPVERNLAWRAAMAYADAAGWPDGFAIELDKRVPVGGGLGGGSADAGAVLRILDHLAPRKLGQSRLLELALRLGADVPFLTMEAPLALAWGRGERLLPRPALPPAAVALLLPAVGVSTVDAFRWLATGRGIRPPAPRVLDLARLESWNAVGALAANDFEEPVGEHVPAIAALAGARPELTTRERGDGTPPALYRMTGSGSTWFALWPTPGGAGGELRGVPDGCRIVWTTTAANVVEVEDVA